MGLATLVYVVLLVVGVAVIDCAAMGSLSNQGYVEPAPNHSTNSVQHSIVSHTLQKVCLSVVVVVVVEGIKCTLVHWGTLQQL